MFWQVLMKENLNVFELPGVLESGYGLSAKWLNDKLYVSVLNVNGYSIEDELYLLAHTRGVVHYGDIWNNDRDYILLEKDKFPSGTLHLILIDSDMNPVSERLVFVNNNDQAQVDFSPDKKVYSTRSLVENTVTLTDSDGEPLEGSFSVSVTDDNDVRPDSASILTNLLLTSDLRGRIENPSYYFQPGNANENSLDLLMITQGWRRYNVSTLLQGEVTQSSSYLEAGSVISGTVKRALSGKPDSGVEMLALSATDDYFEVAITDDNGRFYFEQCELPDSSTIVVGMVSKKATNLSELFLDLESFPSRTTLPPVEKEVIDDKQMTAYVEKSEQRYSHENGMRNIFLDEVTVTASRIKRHKSPYYSTPDQMVTEEQINSSVNRKVYDYLVPYGLHSIIVDKGEDAGKTIIKFQRFSKEVTVLIDDMPVPSSFLKTINLHDVEQIDILKSQFKTMLFSNKPEGGVIAIHLRRGANPFDTNSTYIKKVEPLGYQKRVEFYSPRYDTPETIRNFTPDLRTTIHWQPNILTDSDGIASFNFYTSDSETSYSVIIEGVTSDGKIIHKEGKIEKVANRNLGYK